MVKAPVKGTVRRAIGMLVKLRIGRRLDASLEGVKGINEEVDCKCCERTSLWLECQSRNYGTTMYGVAVLAGYTYKPDVGVRVRRHKTETLLSHSTFSRPTSLSNSAS